MAHGPTYRVSFRRRREGRTDYRQRLALLKSGQTRLVVRRTGRNTIVQFVNFDPAGDQIQVQATAQDLKAMGWKRTGTSTPAGYLTGLLAGTRAKAAGISNAVLDLGPDRPTTGGVSFAVLKGVLDAGIEVPHGADERFPSDDRIRGAHLGDDVASVVESIQSKVQGGA